MTQRQRTRERACTVILALVIATFAAYITAVGIHSFLLHRRPHEADERIGFSLALLSAAIEGFKVEYGASPPNADACEIRDFISRNFHLSVDAVSWLKSRGFDIASMDEREGLVFWLGGIPVRAGQREIAGFPFRPGRDFSEDTRLWKRGYPFEADRLLDSDGDGWLEYVGPPDREGVFVLVDGKARYARATERGT